MSGLGRSWRIVSKAVKNGGLLSPGKTWVVRAKFNRPNVTALGLPFPKRPWRS